LNKSPKDNPEGYRTPEDVGLKYHNIVITTRDDVLIRGWICLNEQSKTVPTIVYFHENAGSNYFWRWGLG